MTDSAIPLGDPLPQRRLIAVPAAGGVIKERPEDFLVDEIPRYEPCGEGEHVYLRVQKTNLPHNELVTHLQRHYGVRESAIGFAGMKDKLAVTQQTVSIHLPGVEAPPPPEHPRVGVLWATRHVNKLRRGHLIGNRFAIRIRKVDPLKAPQVMRHLRSLERTGIPDYYGYQRFGYRRNNHTLGLLLLRQQWEQVLVELLGTRGSPSPSHQRARRELFDAGQHAEALGLWSRGDRAERAAVAALASGATPERAVRAISPAMLAFWVSAIQSCVFNHALDRRLDEGLLDQIIEGDVAWKHDTRRTFLAGPEEMADPEFAERVRRFELSASGPLPGPGMMRPTGRPAELEAASLAADGLTDADFAQIPYGGEGTRRPYRVHVTAIDCDSGFDEHGPYIRVAFELPRGAYATVVLRELIGEGAEGGEQLRAPEQNPQQREEQNPEQNPEQNLGQNED